MGILSKRQQEIKGLFNIFIPLHKHSQSIQFLTHLARQRAGLAVY
jgi:hypothetical protein